MKNNTQTEPFSAYSSLECLQSACFFTNKTGEALAFASKAYAFKLGTHVFRSGTHAFSLGAYGFRSGTHAFYLEAYAFGSGTHAFSLGAYGFRSGTHAFSLGTHAFVSEAYPFFTEAVNIFPKAHQSIKMNTINF